MTRSLFVMLVTLLSAPALADPPPRVLVISSMIGYVEPCGCTVDLLLGGIDRVAAAVAAERAKGPTAVLVVGPTLFEHAIEAHAVGQEEAKAQLINRALGQMKIDAIVRTPEDLLRGAAFAKGLPGTDVTTNVAGGAGKLLTLGAAKIGVLGVVGEGEVVPGGTATAPAAAASAAAKALRAQGAQVVIGLAGIDRKALRGVARNVEGVDLWVLGRHPEERSATSKAGDAYVIEAGDRGRNVGRLVLHELAKPGRLTDPVGDVRRERERLAQSIKMRRFMVTTNPNRDILGAIAKDEARLAALKPPTNPTGKRFEYDLISLPKTSPRDPTVQPWLEAYNQKLQTINLASAGEVPPVPAGKRGFVGDAECVDCHMEAKEVWDKTPHAKAWQTLVDAKKTFDAKCVSCHVIGWQQPGGTVLGKTAGKENVQCEACHGPGSIHAERGGGEAHIERKVPAKVCEVCHHPHHSPKFDYDTYLPKILGPGHGQPYPAPATP